MGSLAIKQQIESLLNFLEPLLGLANCHMVDFFTKSCYKKFVPDDIKHEIEKIGQEASKDLIFNQNLSQVPNLQNFVENSLKFTLKNCHVCLTIDAFVSKLQTWGENIDKFKLEIFMSAKKSHEVEILSAVAAAVAKLSKTSHLVDIGDGKGYLSLMLALHHKIAVLGVDASNVNTCGAIKRATKLSKVWNNIPSAPHKSYPRKDENLSSANVDLYRQVTEFVDDSFNLEKLVVDCFGATSDSLRLGLVGLHTCGNLSPNSLNIFKNDCVKSICNVGCCYHLITERFEEGSKEFGFPMSQFLTEKKFTIGRSARMIANQSIERILTARDLPNITIFYRAVLQVILEQFCVEMPKKHVGKFRKLPKNFLEYVRTALERIDANLDLTDEQIDEFYQKYQNRMNELNVFYLIRGKLAPVIESLILLDRLLFLREQGVENSFLVQFFDPVVSPRCYGIVALK